MKFHLVSALFDKEYKSSKLQESVSKISNSSNMDYAK